MPRDTDALAPRHEAHPLPARPLTRGPEHHFFGYYDKSPWDATGRYLLAGAVDFIDRPNTADDALTIKLIDLADGRGAQTLDVTTAWSWQQGTMLQWMPGAADRWVIYNRRRADRFEAVMRDVVTGESHRLPLPIYSLSPDGQLAVTPSFARLAHARPGYGYRGIEDPGRDDPSPADDGLFVMDLKTQEHRQVASLDQLARHKPVASMDGALHWVNHPAFSRDARRISFLHRWRQPHEQTRQTRLFTMNPDGSDLHLLNPEPMTSHYDWRNGRELLAWAHRPERGGRYYLFSDGTTHAEVWGEGVLERDGHCSFSPDGRWVLTDTYPIDEHRTLMLYEVATGRRIDIGRYHSPPELTGEIRCDLHPRWSRDGRRVCVDSAHEGDRQMYEVDVSAVVV